VVSIFTYRDERKLFAVVGAIIVAAVVALIQLDAAKSGRPSLITIAVGSTALFVQSAAAGLGNTVRGASATLGDAPRLYARNAELSAENRSLRGENARLQEALAEAPEAAAIARSAAELPGAIVATVVGFDPENLSRIVTIDRGSEAGVHRDDGVIDEDGVVGRVVDVTPLSSTVLLAIDGASKVPAVVQRGRWWGIATGTNSRIRLQYVSQDAKLHVGDAVVTGEGRSFRAGLALGRISEVDHPEGALYQTALIEPAVAFGRISRVLVLPHAMTSDEP
jgi:rod shape-determining protein MreC